MSPILTSSVDAYVDQANPDRNYGDRAKLKLRGTGSTAAKHAYLYFALPFGPDVTVLSATLRVYAASAWGGTRDVICDRIDQAWKEGRITWDNRPDVDTAEQATFEVVDAAEGDEFVLDLQPMLAAISAGAAYFGVRLSLDTDVLRDIYSSDHPDLTLRPTLEVEWTSAPAPPSNLAPSGGRAVAPSKPVLAWQFTDAGGGRQTSSQVQISTTADFTTPEYDSTKVANTQSRWDLTATAYAGLSNDDVRFWRVRVWDDSDLASEWSDPVEFERKTHGMLTITSPDAPPDDFVEETTPPVSWTFTGRTQEAFSIVLYRVPASGAAVELFRTARTVSDDQTFTLPAGLIRSGETFAVVVVVEDDLDRQPIAGDPGIVSATRYFIYERAGTPAEVESLSAAPDGAKVILTIERTLEPDYFALRVDGVEVADRIEPSEIFIGSNTYELAWWGAIPRQTHTYEVEAVVDDAGVLKHSAGNPTDSARTDPAGIYLADPADDTAIRIAGREAAELTIGESGETLYPIAGSTPVRITDAIRGYEGAVSGVLESGSARDDFLDLKGRVVELRLVVGDLNLPVRLEQASVAPDPIPGDVVYPVTFAFFQSGEEPVAVVAAVDDGILAGDDLVML